jgi:hypothetical protein
VRRINLGHVANVLGNRRTLSSTWPTCSLTYCWVLAAQGVKEALRWPCQHIVDSVW